ncbi:hypothetical protein [Brevibacillus brevis]|uniref:hypothetical protein n=1 Tax=Brevibacillus brevis TaxID=1393 RepID=UPI0025A4D617|nr:hypothetical protein [Brevibacillus brevis]WJQ81494.1 hypothetical protein QN310_29350 [Brevibacillus brevis]
MTRAKLTLSMIVKNEGNRYLRRALEVHKDFIDAAVIIDDDGGKPLSIAADFLSRSTSSLTCAIHPA